MEEGAYSPLTSILSRGGERRIELGIFMRLYKTTHSHYSSAHYRKTRVGA